MSESIFTLINKINDSEKLSANYVCEIAYSLSNAYYNSYYWTIQIFGTETYANKDEIKKNNFSWNKRSRKWVKSIDNVPKEEIDKMKKTEIEFYHSKGLSFPYCKPKCSKIGCNNSKYDNEVICADCNYKERCVGGLKCKGWMSVNCKYDGLTCIGSLSCEECNNDAFNWAEEGRKINGPGGWFGNDRS